MNKRAIFKFILSLVGCLLVTFLGSGLRFGGEGRPGSEQSGKNRTTLHMKPKTFFVFRRVLFVFFGGVLESVFVL